VLVIFYQVHGEIKVNSSAWRFISGYLQAIFIVAAWQDKHSPKVNVYGINSIGQNSGLLELRVPQVVFPGNVMVKAKLESTDLFFM
jgi:hypothetical protein